MKILITGGVGFIGTNTAKHFAQNTSNSITIVDNFSREGVNMNAEYLKKNFSNITIKKANVQDIPDYLDVLKKADVIIHLAGQTAVTTSIKNPLLDFESNVRGSFLLLEAVRVHNPKAIVLYSSTNKVYGDLSHHTIYKDEKNRRYINHDFPDGVDETERLDFISPYGCSKGSMDAYMEDYARIYGLNTVVFRQSCIYGPFQMGVEDQGWVAHFSKQMIHKKPITIYGDGYQVRDLLYVDDLVNAYQRAIDNIDKVRGEAFNIGGGVENSFSLVEVLDILEEEIGNKIKISYDQTRAGDQHYFVSKNSKIKYMLEWTARTSFRTGVLEMIKWQQANL